jgi:ABC-type branched-subunit amino acid transport system substrate-binding protein
MKIFISYRHGDSAPYGDRLREALAAHFATGKAVVKTGGDTWFFITADYAFGHALERYPAAVIEANAGKVLGRVRAPLNNNNFSSFLFQAQSSKAKAIANANGDIINGARTTARARPRTHRDLVLGHERREPRMDQALGGGAAGLRTFPP